MASSFAIRRHQDGALDIGHHRRRAARLHRIARRRAGRAAAALLGRLADRARSPRQVAVVAVAALGVWIGAAMGHEFRTELLLAETLGDGRVFRMTVLDLAPGAATAPHRLPAETLLLVTAGTVVRDGSDGAAVAFGTGAFFAADGLVVLRNPGEAAARIAVGSVTARGEPPFRPLSFSE
jgi:hypothetical protein